MHRWTVVAFSALAALLVLPVAAQAPSDAAGLLRIGYLGFAPERALPSTFLDPPPRDEGVAGARVGIADNTTTGRFTRQRFELIERPLAREEDAADAFRALAGEGIRFVLADLPAARLLEVADLPEARDAVILNVGSPDDRLRESDCRANVLHLLPSRAMLADALMQHLVARRWSRVLLAVGPQPADALYAEAVRRAARKFGVRIVADKPWTFESGLRRTDTGHFSVAAEAARFTQGVSYDVLVVADENGDWGDGLEYRTTDPRPVAGTQGLVPTAWARPFEQWGATQMQRRFLNQANRWMLPRDYAAYLAVRAVGEGATRARSTEPVPVAAYLRSPGFEVAGFKGVRLSFRAWDGQLRQPVLLAASRSLVSVSPQPGFLHQFSELDTLGTDRPESPCRRFAAP